MQFNLPRRALCIAMEMRERHIAFVIDQKGRAWVTDPGVVVLHMDHTNVFHAIEDLAYCRNVLAIHAYRDGLEASDGLDDLSEDLLSGLGAAAPHVRTVRPQDLSALLFLVLTGNIEAVFFGRRFALVDGLHGDISFRKAFCGQRIACPCGKDPSMVLISPFAERMGTFCYPKDLVFNSVR